MPARPHRSRATPPNRGTDAPHTPLRPPAGVTGTRAWWQRASTAATWAVSVGRATTAGLRRHLAGHRPADGQRPPVPSRLGPVLVQRRDPGAHAGQPLEQAPVHRHPPAAEVVGHPARLGVDGRHRRGPDHPGSPAPPVEDPALAGPAPAGVQVGPGPGRPGPIRAAGPRRSPRPRLRCAPRPNRVRGRSARPRVGRRRRRPARRAVRPGSAGPGRRPPTRPSRAVPRRAPRPRGSGAPRPTAPTAPVARRPGPARPASPSRSGRPGGWRWRWPRPGRPRGPTRCRSGGPAPGPSAPPRAAGGPWWRSGGTCAPGRRPRCPRCPRPSCGRWSASRRSP